MSTQVILRQRAKSAGRSGFWDLGRSLRDRCDGWDAKRTLRGGRIGSFSRLCRETYPQELEKMSLISPDAQCSRSVSFSC